MSAPDPLPAPAARTPLPRRYRVSPAAKRRAIYALIAVAGAEVVGTIGLHLIENASWINAFYFESMLATGQGPPFPLVTNAGKIFASIMAYVSVGSVLTALFFAVGPIVARFWHESLDRIEEDVRRIEHGARAEIARLEEELHHHRSEPHPPGPRN